ncbi:MAG: amylo-alpha-1,6-glucosidase [Planctomycetota bacterium]
MPSPASPTPAPSSAPPVGPDAWCRFDRAALHKLELSLSREWLETDGRGGYASSTVLGCPTRRYHGLLVAIPDGSSERHAFLSRFEERVSGHGKSYPLTMTRYRGCFVPDGEIGVESFELVPWPRWTFQIGLARFVREVLTVRGRRTVLVRYRDVGEREGITLTLRPLLACRRADSLTFENMSADTRTFRSRHGHAFRPYGALPAVELSFGRRGAAADEALRYEADPTWYRGVEYPADVARGYDGHEDQLCPGWYDLSFPPGAEIVVAASIDGATDDPVALWDEESARRTARVAAAGSDLRGRLELASDDFLWRDAHGRPGVVAGYPWFGEWGRDTFISLPGLTLAQGHVEACTEVLRGALPFLVDGLLPNIYGATVAESHYGSADAALWFALAVWRANDHDPRLGIAREFAPALRSIVDAYRGGAPRAKALGLFVDDGGLLHAGSRELNATWMDARTDDGPVTPREGFAVELQALWCFLLRWLAELDWDPDVVALADRADASFVERFWIDEESYLADTWRPGGGPAGTRDVSVRPNQVVAAALPHSPLTRSRRAEVVRRCELELLTPRGLRTLAPKNPAYVGRYAGGPKERDEAYHQGTVWPWLLGFHVEATLRAFPHDAERAAKLRALIEGFAEHLQGQGLGQVSEVFDGDPPHRPGGTIAQAWSVAELRRTLALLDGERS